VIGLSSVEKVTDRHIHAVYDNKHLQRAS